MGSEIKKNDQWKKIKNIIFEKIEKENISQEEASRKYIEEIHSELKKDPDIIDFLQNDLGLLSAGALFATEWNKSFSFMSALADKGKNKQTYFTPYIWQRKLPEEDDKENKLVLLINNLFFVVRDEQRIRVESGEDTEEEGLHTEEFFTKLNADNDWLHYCSIGEVLFYCYSWRLLCRYKDYLDEDKKFIVDDEKRKDFLKFEGRATLCWQGIDLPSTKWKDGEITFWKKTITESPDPVPLFEFEEESKVLKYTKGWLHEWEVLGLVKKEDNNFKPTPSLLCLINYIRIKEIGSISIPEDLTNPLTPNDLDKLDLEMQRTIVSYLGKETISANLDELIKKAPFPILPFYFWIALDEGNPKAYFVAPVWISPGHPTKIFASPENKKIPIVGVALCATNPLKKLDDTLSGVGETELPISNADPIDLNNFLSLLFAPLVEINFYGPLRKELLNRREKELRAAVMGRNFSHNIGSHVLGSTDFIDMLGGKSKRIRYILYFQARLDFISKMLEEYEQQGQPFFLNSIKGMIKGNVARKIEGLEPFWTIMIQGQNYKELKIEFDEIEGQGDHIVIIPGGLVGMHAIYSIIENILRNAAKYGSGTSKELKIKFKFNEVQPAEASSKQCIEVTVIDQVSSVQSNGDANLVKIREKLNQTLVEAKDQTGAQHKSRGYGIHEIRMCAQFLAQNITYITDPYNGENGYSITRKLPVTCFQEKTEQRLAYKFLLQKPIFIGFWDSDLTQIYNASNWFITPNFDDILGEKPYFAVLFDKGNMVIPDVTKILKENHTKLPFRCFLITTSETRKELWEEKLQNETLDRRILVVSIADRRFSALTNTIIEELKSFRIDTNSNNNQIISNIYELWLRILYSDDEKHTFRLIIAFERRDSNVERWKKCIENFNSRLVDIFIVDTTDHKIKASSDCDHEGKDVKVLFPDVEEQLPKDSTSNFWTIIYDNHDMISQKISDVKQLKTWQFEKTPDFYQNFGSSTPDLFHDLNYPPTSDQFSCSFFIISLVESSLLKIAVLDERVAEELLDNFLTNLDPGEFRMKGYGGCRRAGVQVLFSIKTDKPIFYLSEKIKNEFLSLNDCSLINNLSGCLNLDQNHGIELIEGESKECGESARKICKNKDCNNISTPNCIFKHDSTPHRPHAIVIHEGILEKMKSKNPDFNPETFIDALYEIAPTVVRTSGRGDISRVRGDNIPFLEFSTLSDSVYGRPNKFSLGRAVMSAVVKHK